MKLRILIVFIISLSAFFSCRENNQGKEKNGNHNLVDFNHKYQHSKSFFDSSFVNHFPSKIMQLPADFIVDTNAISDHVRFMLNLRLSNFEIDSLDTELIAKSLSYYNANDSCLLIVNRFTNKENWHLRSKHNYVVQSQISKKCYEGKYPIPNFWDNQYSSNTTEVKLPDDFIIYVLEARKGKYWDSKHRTNGQYMPHEWKNGYSKGVAISKERKLVIYWFIIW